MPVKVIIHHAIEDFVREQIRLKLQIADGKADTTKINATSA